MGGSSISIPLRYDAEIPGGSRIPMCRVPNVAFKVHFVTRPASVLLVFGPLLKFHTVSQVSDE